MFKFLQRSGAVERSAAPQHVLDALYAVVESRKGAAPEGSHTARLFARGTAKIGQKVGEEAIEVVIEGVQGDRGRLAEESADLLYHLLVLWADRGVRPEEVWRVLAARRAAAAGAGEGEEGKAEDRRTGRNREKAEAAREDG